MQPKSNFINLGDGIQLHYVRFGTGKPVLFLHGWPGFWYDWRHVMPLVAQNADVIAVDFRGFGESSKPDLPPETAYTPNHLAGDIIGLLNALQISQVTLVAHDIGATIAQHLAGFYPERIRNLVLLNPPYPGIGLRRFEPNAQREFWYQHFHQLNMCAPLVGYNRDTVKIYLSHFYSHWMGNTEALVPCEFDIVVDMYARPQAFDRSIQYYRARAGSKNASSEPRPTVKIAQPTAVLWGTHDPVIPVTWSDSLSEYFEDVTVHRLDGIGHFVPIEAPEQVAKAVRLSLGCTERDFGFGVYCEG